MALLTNLVSYWKLDESSGNAADSKGSNTLTNVNTVTYAAAKLNNGAFLAKASSQALKITDASQSGLGVTSDFSMSIWIKPTSHTVLNVLMQKQGLSGLDSYAIYLNTSGNILFQVGNGVSQDSKTFVSGISDGSWYHVVCTWKASTSALDVYINGLAIGTQTGVLTAMSTTNQDFTLGSNQTENGGFYDGVMDEVGFWSRQLSASEVTSLYNGGSPLPYPLTVASTSNLLMFMGPR